MPIRINLLAEAQAAEELRRRDPVKRTLLVGGVCVALVLFWCLLIQFQIIRANSDLKRFEVHWSTIEKRHTQVTDNLKESGAIERKLNALDRLSTNRFLWGSTLNALQQTVVDHVQMTRLKGDQTYTFIDGVPAKTTGTKPTPAKPAATVEKVTLHIEAKDWSPVEQNYNKFKEALATFPHFQASLTNRADALRLTALSKPAFDPSDPLRPFVVFTLEMQYPEVHRDE